MSVVFGLITEDPGPTDARWGMTTEIGCRFVRMSAPDASDFAKAASVGVMLLPILYSLSDSAIQSYVNTLYSGGVPVAGWCGIVELGNESYLSSGVPSFTSGTAYWNAIFPGIQHAIAAHATNPPKFVIEVDYTHQSAWMDQIWTAAGSNIQYVWGIAPHNYTVPHGSATVGDPITGGTGIVAQLAHYNTFLLGKHATNSSSPLIILATEQGWSTEGANYNAVPSEAIQADYYTKAIAIYSNPASYVSGWGCVLAGALFFELQDNPWQADSNSEGGFGLVRSTTSDWSAASAPTGERKPAYSVVKNALAASGNPDFTGAGGGGGGGAPLQVHLALDTDHSQVLVTNVDPACTVMKFAVMTSATPVITDPTQLKYYTVSAPFPSPFVFKSPDPTFPWIDAAQYDGSGNQLAAWFSSSTGGARIQTFPALADAPVVTTVAADGIVASGGVLHGSVALGNQQNASALFRYGPASGVYDQQTVTIPLVGTPASLAAIALRGTPTTVTNATSTTCITTAPAARVAGDVLLLGVLVGSKTVTINTPATWHVAIAQQGETSEAWSAVVFWKISDGTSNDAPTVTWGGTSNLNQAVMAAYSGTDVIAPISVAANAFRDNSTASTSAVVDALTTTQDKSLPVTFVFNDGAVAVAPGAGYTEDADTTSGVEVSHKSAVISPAGTTGSITHTLASAKRSLTGMVALGAAGTGYTATFSATITDRQPVTAVHYVAEVSSQGGTDQGSDATFTTTSGLADPAVTTGIADLIASTQAELMGNIDSLGGDTDVDWYFLLGTDTLYTMGQFPLSAENTDATGAVSAIVVGLAPGTIYHYALVATNSHGSVQGDDVQFVTLPAEPPPPSGPGLPVPRTPSSVRDIVLPDEPEILASREGFPDAQAALTGPPTRLGLLYSLGWYGSAVSRERGSFALVNRGGPLEAYVGDRLKLSTTDESRSVYVYVIATELLDHDIHITRRTFAALQLLAMERIDILVDVISG